MCQHELLYDGCFNSAKYDTRWYNHKYYEDNVVSDIIPIIEAPINISTGIEDKEKAKCDDSIIEVYSLKPKSAVTYTDLSKICNSLIHLVSHDTKKSKNILSVLKQ